MTERFPLLAALRAQWQREEDEIAEPHKRNAGEAMQMAREERAARQGLEKIMRSKVAPYLVEELGRTMGRELERKIMEASMSALRVTPQTTITVPTGLLMYADPNSIVSNVVNWWKRENAPRMEFRAIKGEMEIKSSVTSIEVRIPEMRYRQNVADYI